MKSNIHKAHLLAVGVLTWCGSERRSDRYGSVMILDRGDPHDHDETGGGATASVVTFGMQGLSIGETGTLSAEVVEVRKSNHIGDLFRGLQPGGAVVGETLILGHGRLFTTMPHSVQCVGVRPADGRDADWLDPKLLYRAHECVVRLTFTPDVS